MGIGPFVKLGREEKVHWYIHTVEVVTKKVSIVEIVSSRTQAEVGTAREKLNRVVQSNLFAQADRYNRFLNYINVCLFLKRNDKS